MALGWITGQTVNLEKLTFGPGRYRRVDSHGRVEAQSIDLEVEGLQDVHLGCLTFLESYDRACVSYLSLVHQAQQTRSNSLSNREDR